MAALVVVLDGCSAGAGQPTGDRSAPVSSVSVPADLTSPVHNPKNLVGTSPCDLIPPAQLANEAIDLPARAQDVLGAPGCVWDNKAHTREIGVYVEIGKEVLRNVYAQRSTFPIFEVTQVAGYPAVRTKDLPDGTSCTFRVAAADRQTFVIDFTSLRQGLEEPCGPARELAEAVLANLPPLKG
ncbi:MAG TPA: DUF3558 domain-containing protein [Pseudonocardiaceae bacterium]